MIERQYLRQAAGHTLEQINRYQGRLNERELTILRAACGRGDLEIAAELGLKLGTVKSRLNRARIVLNGLIEAQRAAA